MSGATGTSDLSQLHRTYLRHLTLPHPQVASRSLASASVRRGLAKGEAWAQTTLKAWTELETTWLKQPERVWIWSDLHLFHANILRYTPRPSPNLDQMHAQLLSQACACVGDGDWLLFLGDVSLGSPEDTEAWLAQCPGRKALILGNHDVDRQKLQRWPQVWSHFEAIASMVAWPAPGEQGSLWLSHYPWLKSHLPAGVINVHGHLHQHVLEGPYVNVSVEQQGLAPRRLMDRLRAFGPEG